MSNSKKNDELQSRREFFKQAAKAALPVVGAAILASVPFVKSEAATGCDYSCSGGCSRGCEGSCQAHCKDDCTGNCSGWCKGSCGNNCNQGCSVVAGSNPY